MLNKEIRSAFINHVAAVSTSIHYDNMIGDFIDALECKNIDKKPFMMILNFENLKQASKGCDIIKMVKRYKHSVINRINYNEYYNLIETIFNYADNGNDVDFSINYETEEKRFKAMLVLNNEKNKNLFVFNYGNVDVTITVENNELNIIYALIDTRCTDIKISLSMGYSVEKGYFGPFVFTSSNKNVGIVEFNALLNSINDIRYDVRDRFEDYNNFTKIAADALNKEILRLKLSEKDDYFQIIPHIDFHEKFNNEYSNNVFKAIKDCIKGYQYDDGSFTFSKRFVALDNNLMIMNPTYDETNFGHYNIEVSFLKCTNDETMTPQKLYEIFTTKYMKQILFENRYRLNYDEILYIYKNFKLWLTYEYPDLNFELSEIYYLMLDYEFPKKTYKTWVEAFERATMDENFDDEYIIKDNDSKVEEN